MNHGIATGRLYRHYKGGLYIPTIITQTHNHNGDYDIIYWSCTHQKYVTRPLYQDSRKEDSWTDFVEWPDGIQRERFSQELPNFKEIFK